MTRTPPISATGRFVGHAVAKTVFIYAVFASLWILLSDQALLLITTDPKTIALISTIKGWMFVLVTSLLLAYLIRNYLKKLDAIHGELRESAEQFKKVVEHSPLAMAMADSDGTIAYLNRKTIETFGYLPQDIPNLDRWWVQAYPDTAYREEVIAQWTGLVAEARDHNHEIEQREYRITCKNGDVKVAAIFGVWVADKVLVIFEDVTARKKTEASMQLASKVFSHAREGIIITDTDGIILDVNDTFIEITGYSREEVLGQNPRMLHSGRQSPEYYAGMWQALIEKGHWFGEIWNRRKNGEVYAEMLTISAVRDANGKTQNYVALFSDISLIKEHQKQLEHIAHYDALTNLPNRVLLGDRMQQSIAQSLRRDKSLAVAYLDLDGFKTVNDRHGHAIGDELLIAVSHRIKAALREGDTLARIGGDEFVALLVDLDNIQDCEPVLERILQAAAESVAVDDLVLQVSGSIGVTLYPQDGADADLLLRHADQAMYLAKQAGKNRYHLFDVAHDAAIKTQRESLEHIHRAFERREFVLHYQPKVNMKSGEVIGVEALIRWQHPTSGLLLPAAFLPIIEDHPLSVELGAWVIDSALTQMSAWHAQGLDMQVSVNISALQLQQTDFVPRLAGLLAAHPGVKPAQLELEILETSALEDVAKVSELMHACRAIGVGFALDDFGTGYSSLTYLKYLPAGLLKIDQTFVRDMLGDVDDLTIVEAVVGLAQAFRRKVIAEGVETVAHGELLLLLGCELAQGFGIARPMPAEDLPGWVATWRPHAAWTAWRERPLNRDDMTVVFAEVEHRHWLAAIETFLADEHKTLPPLDAQVCRFGLWQKSEGAARYGAHHGFPLLCAVHDRVHALGQEMVGLHAQGRKADALARLGELHALRDELIGRLRELVNGEEKAAAS